MGDVYKRQIMNVTAVVSLRGLPAEAVYGMSSAFYYLFEAIVFLILSLIHISNFSLYSTCKGIKSVPGTASLAAQTVANNMVLSLIHI